MAPGLQNRPSMRTRWLPYAFFLAIAFVLGFGMTVAASRALADMRHKAQNANHPLPSQEEAYSKISPGVHR